MISFKYSIDLIHEIRGNFGNKGTKSSNEILQIMYTIATFVT